VFGVDRQSEKLHLTRGNDPLHCTPPAGEPARGTSGFPISCWSSHPSSGAEIQSEYLMDRRYAGPAIDALRGAGTLIAPLVRSAEIRTVAADELWLQFGVTSATSSESISPGSRCGAVAAVVPQIRGRASALPTTAHWAKVFGRRA
jgi:xylitol oxidase